MVPFWNLIAAGAEDMWNFAGGLIARKAAKNQKELSQQMIRDAQKLSSQYERPEFQIPAAIQQQMSGLQGRQFQQMPGMHMALGQMNRAFTQGLGAAERSGRGGEAFGAAGDMYARQLEQIGGMQQQQAMYQDRAQMDYLQGLGNLGQWQQQKWRWDKADPYLAAQQKAAQMETMGRMGEYEATGAMGGAMASSIAGVGQSASSMLGQLGAAGVFNRNVAPASGGGGANPNWNAANVSYVQPPALQTQPQWQLGNNGFFGPNVSLNKPEMPTNLGWNS